MKKLALAILSLSVLAAPATAETVGLNVDINVYKTIAEFAQTKNGGSNVVIVTTDQAASSFGGFNPRNPLPSTLEPVIQSR
ncbi:MAG: hypothetical protein ABJK39_13170 [Hyphomicrobiales bacterium]